MFFSLWLYTIHLSPLYDIYGKMQIFGRITLRTNTHTYTLRVHTELSLNDRNARMEAKKKGREKRKSKNTTCTYTHTHTIMREIIAIDQEFTHSADSVKAPYPRIIQLLFAFANYSIFYAFTHESLLNLNDQRERDRDWGILFIDLFHVYFARFNVWSHQIKLVQRSFR